jgi:hypothetical protein
MWQVAATARL